MRLCPGVNLDTHRRPRLEHPSLAEAVTKSRRFDSDLSQLPGSSRLDLLALLDAVPTDATRGLPPELSAFAQERLLGSPISR